MKKIEQMGINEKCWNAWERAMQEYVYERPYYSKPLRSCNAEVYETSNYYILQSYSTLIAVIDKATDTCYDLLRKVYGYTATSGKHVAKFRQDFGAGKWGCEREFTYREV